ncbi:hypothetical protein FN846DRAFT_998187 [Sphaerosporella brunnea]|uniref:VWFA domain-containing protein n=1 Tax=Sphaerosporella brunnea TaxID=1250544 RepID=A0A5J5EIB9_9PEZI|nr:hypothetical protein FN846DRAFT_998187 [Sphaerosporella brunnea]
MTTLPKNLTEHCQKVLKRFIENEKKDLSVFYSDANLAEAAKKAAAMVEKLVDRGCSVEYALRFTALTLYDLVILLDDSDTMVLAEEGQRKVTLHKVLMEVSDIYSLARDEGIVSVRFFNTKKGRKNVTPAKVDDVLNKVAYTGLTKIGTELKQKILDPFLYKEAAAGKLKKPLLIMIITDGDVEGEAQGFLKTQINNCIAKLQDTANWKMGRHAAAFYFSRIGNDDDAKALIEGLDNDPSLGKWIDCFPVDERLEDLKVEEGKPRNWDVVCFPDSRTIFIN